MEELTDNISIGDITPVPQMVEIRGQVSRCGCGNPNSHTNLPDGSPNQPCPKAVVEKDVLLGYFSRNKIKNAIKQIEIKINENKRK